MEKKRNLKLQNKNQVAIFEQAAQKTMGTIYSGMEGPPWDQSPGAERVKV